MGKETSQSLAYRALRAVTRNSPSSIQYSSVPLELLIGDDIDYQKWSIILKDKDLKILSEQSTSYKRYFLSCSCKNVSDMFKSFWDPHIFQNGIVRLNLMGAKEISDYGIGVVARKSPNLFYLNISSCINLTDGGLREVGLNCPDLKELIMSSCYNIEGSGLVAIAECCKSLSILDVSKCSRLQNWSLNKIFYKCSKLHDINLNHLKDVGDDEIRVLAQNCLDLTSFHAVECFYVSDTSMLSLSQNCLDLSLVDLTRSQMSFRITDVSLLAFGQRSKSLKVLRLSGCDHITDVGLTWLAEGCKVLEELDLCRCNKITDAGLRSIGNSCHGLQSIDISYVKAVSDIGLSSLSNGCPVLKKLNCHAIFLLSDPRLVAVTKGAKLESWQSLIGIAALTTNCPLLEDLNLSGCFRLSIALHQYISSLQHLKVLNLSGCNQTTTESFQAIGNGCKAIEELYLSDCGKSVDNKCIESFVENCMNLRILNICRCVNIRGKAIKAISTCKKLEKLELNGCKFLNDTMLIYLCETDTLPSLKSLSFVDLPLITDTIVAWIAIKTHNILILALKGSLITKKALMSVKDRFPNSDLLTNENFYGFWPKYRVEDRVLINKYYCFIHGIIFVQNKYRAFKAKERVNGLRYEKLVSKSLKLVQCTVRMFLAKCRTIELRRIKNKMQKSALIITSIFYIPIARKIFNKKKLEKLIRYKNKCAKLIQLRYRIFRDQKILKNFKLQKKNYLQKRLVATIKIQSIAQVYFANNKIKKMKLLITQRKKLYNRVALIIQRCYRGFKGRQLSRKLKFLKATEKKRRNLAVSKIQKNVRCRRTHKILGKKMKNTLHRKISAIIIQALMRGALARIYITELKFEKKEKTILESTIKIQSLFRIRKATKILKIKKKEKAILTLRQNIAATTINNGVRINKAWKIYKIKKIERFEELKKQANLEINSVIKIQALFRGHCGRLLTKQKIKEKKQKWKELFDEKKQKRFFYNKLTGEIRWRIPKDLLDLIPRPQCDNCTEYEAIVECSVCNELYCNSCFEQVHRGGRRKTHEFRSIYDYFGKRLDYGDGVFPSKWPTEVIQDEVQGWMLRVAPMRLPIAKFSFGWEEYFDLSPIELFDDEKNSSTIAMKKIRKGKEEQERTFFFNRNTFEATYEIPTDIIQERFELEQLKQREDSMMTNNSFFTSRSGVQGLKTPVSRQQQHRTENVLTQYSENYMKSWTSNNEEHVFNDQTYDRSFNQSFDS